MRHDVAIYSTSAGTAGLYDHAHGRAGGAERQMTLLARALVARGHRVAHITYKPRAPVELDYPLSLVYRAAYSGGRPLTGSFREALVIWRALSAANAKVVVLRTASPLVGVAAAFCAIRRRAFVFSSSNVSDFTLERMRSRRDRLLYRLGIRLADAVVVQSEDQIALARRAFPSLRTLLRIPSFAEPAPTERHDDGHAAQAFLWLGRCVPQKQPLKYVALAKSLPEARFTMIPVPDGASGRELEAVTTAAREVRNLQLLEPLAHAQIRQVMRSAVAVVNTSVLEGMPNTFLEAWANGVPVLTLQFDPDGVVQRHNLGVSAGGSWDRFVAGARELWQRRGERDDVDRRVRAYVEDVHSMAAVGDRWSELVADLSRRS